MAEKLWGGRFSKKTEPSAEEFTSSIQYDYRLARYDVLGSIAHVILLKKAGYLTVTETEKLKNALESIYRSIESKSFIFNRQCEDIHTALQNIVAKKAGPLALKLHTARSRNEQVVFATILYCKDNIRTVLKDINGLSSALDKLAKKNHDIIIPGFTHLQHAQPVYLMDYLGAYLQMLERDKERLSYIYKSLNPSMGAGALAGTPIPAAAYRIKGVSVTSNSIDLVSDRDFVIEIISALSILAMHLSRLSEDMIIWSTKEFDFVEIDDAYCTGSSLMPQKKNPDVLELIRGHTGRLYGNLISVLTMMKGLPLAYNRDMQLDKEPLLNSFDIVTKELEVLKGLIKTLKFNKGNIKEVLRDESLYATDLVYYLIDKKLPFKQAHHIIGRLVNYSLDKKRAIRDMSEDELKRFSDKLIKKEIAKLFDPIVSVRAKKSIKKKR